VNASRERDQATEYDRLWREGQDSMERMNLAIISAGIELERQELRGRAVALVIAGLIGLWISRKP
jgi:hypothetical protein